MLTRLEKHSLARRVGAVSICAGILALVLGLYFINRVAHTYEDKVISDMAASAKILAASFDAKSVDLRNSLKSMAQQEVIVSADVPLNEKLAVLNRYAERNGLVRAGITNLEGVASTSEGGTFNAVDREWFTAAKSGRACTSSNLYDRMGTGGEIIVFSEPIRRNKEVVAVLFATQYIAEYLNTTQMQVVDRANEVYVIDDKGSILAGVNRDENAYGLLAIAKGGSDPGSFQSFKNDLTGGRAGHEELSFNGAEYLTVYAPTSAHNNWFVVLTLSTQDLDQQTSAILRPFYIALAVGVVCFALFAGFLALVNMAWLAERKENKRLLNQNDLLPQVPGIKSKISVMRDIENYYAKMDPNELALVGIVTLKNVERYAEIFGHDSVNKLRLAFAEKIAFLCNRSCKIAYADIDRYVVFATGFYSRKECRDYMMRIQAAITESFEFKGCSVRLDSQCGAKIYFKNDDVAKSATELIEAADFAWQHAKPMKSSIMFYDYDMQVAQKTANNLAKDLPGALERGEYCIVYQPYYDAHTKRLAGFEAMIRWKHPSIGVIAPSEFLPLAIEDGSILELGRWSIDTIFGDAQKLASAQMPLLFKVPSVELLTSDYADYVALKFEEKDLDPHSLVLELDDRNIGAVYEQAEETIERIKALGIDIELDNFAWWLTSAGYLTSLPVDTLRINRAYCPDVLSHSGFRDTLGGVLSVAKGRGLKTYLKGVANKNEMDLLKDFDFSYTQGNYFSRLLTFEMAQEVLENESLANATKEGGSYAES